VYPAALVVKLFRENGALGLLPWDIRDVGTIGITGIFGLTGQIGQTGRTGVGAVVLVVVDSRHGFDTADVHMANRKNALNQANVWKCV